METRAKTGACRFCGQIRVIEKTEDEWLEMIKDTNKDASELADDLATMECSCREGSDFRAAALVIDRCGENIEAMLREKYPEIADIFQETKQLVYYQKIKKMTVMTPENGTASMFKKGGSIMIKFVQKSETEMSAEW